VIKLKRKSGIATRYAYGKKGIHFRKGEQERLNKRERNVNWLLSKKGVTHV